jgi:hypothetical protein
MAKRTRDPNKPEGFFSRLRSIHRFTREVYNWLPWMQVGFILVGIALGILVSYLVAGAGNRPEWWSMLLWCLTGALFGVLAALILMTRLSMKVMYQKLDGMPGAVGHILSTSLGRKWAASEMPVGINPKTQEAVYRAVGRGGIVVIGEGARGRLTRLIKEETMKAQRVANGVPLTVYYVGHGDEDVPLDKLSKSIKKLPRAINKATMAAVVKRFASVSQSLASLPIPKGIDPTKVRAPRPR